MNKELNELTTMQNNLNTMIQINIALLLAIGMTIVFYFWM
jgi:hypothetical protein